MSRQRGAEKVIVGRQRCTARHHDQVYTGVAHWVTAAEMMEEAKATEGLDTSEGKPKPRARTRARRK